MELKNRSWLCINSNKRTGRLTYRFDARMWNDHVLWTGVADTVEALLDRLGELAAHGNHRIHAQRMRHVAAASARRRHGRQVGKDADQNVVVVGGRRLVGQVEGPRQLGADADHGGCAQDAVDSRPSPALERHLGVRVRHGRVALAHPHHPRHEIFRRRRVDGGPLDGQEVTELIRRESVDVINTKRIPLLRLDINTRRLNKVFREQVKVVDVSHTDSRDQVVVCWKTLGAARSRYVQDVRSGRRRRRGCRVARGRRVSQR